MSDAQVERLAEALWLRAVGGTYAEHHAWLGARYADDGRETWRDQARVLLAELERLNGLRGRMEALADEFDSKGGRGSAHFGADIGDTIRLWIERDPRTLPPEATQ